MNARPEMIDLWLLASPPDAQIDIYAAVLTGEERQRAARFRMPEDRTRCIVARGGTRRILATYTGLAPRQLRFETGPQGKPHLAGGGADIHFNLSHSGDYVLLAVTRGLSVGVDIERIRHRKSEDAIAERFFCPSEVAWLKRTPGGFFRLWTAKEAAIKATGHGLAMPLTEVNVTTVVSSADGATLEIPGVPTLWIRELEVPAGYAAAVALEGEGRAIRWMPVSWPSGQ